MARSARSGQVVAELLRLGIVLLLTAGGYAIGEGVDEVLGLDDAEATRLVTSVLGALVGYLLGGAVGRAVVSQVDEANRRLERIPAAQLVTASIGAALGGFVGVALLLPILLLPYQRFTVPVAILVVLVLAYAGGRLGASRGPDLGRFIGVRGRLDVSAPSRGGGIKLLDTSALIDARIVEVARVGFLEGTLVVPTFVLLEVQRLADAADDRRRELGKRGLQALQVLQDEGLVPVEVTDDDPPGVAEVDAKLVTLCRERRAALVTTDGNLARVAEIAGVRVLNPHALADAVRPPVLPGDRVALRLLKPGREPGQGVGYLEDGTMVVVDDGGDRIGDDVQVDVTSIVQNRQGRMLFGGLAAGGADRPPTVTVPAPGEPVERGAS
jgi:uncharacterized protein YacL